MNKRKVMKSFKIWLKNNKQVKIDDDFKIVISNDGDFYCDSEKKEIGIGDCNVPAQDYQDLLDLCKELGYCGDLNPLTISLLHEIGHYFNDKTLSKEDDLKDERLREQIEKIIENKATQEYGLWLYYHILDCEVAATQWAVDFATKHPIVCRRLEKMIFEN